MAFSGLHVACGYAGAVSARRDGMQILGKLIWSETMASAATTALSAPEVNDLKGDPIFQVRASADSYVAIAATPNATSGARLFVPAGDWVEMYAEPGDKLAWITA